jgi:hypothetical protein
LKPCVEATRNAGGGRPAAAQSGAGDHNGLTWFRIAIRRSAPCGWQHRAHLNVVRLGGNAQSKLDGTGSGGNDGKRAV